MSKTRPLNPVANEQNPTKKAAAMPSQVREALAGVLTSFRPARRQMPPTNVVAETSRGNEPGSMINQSNKTNSLLTKSE